MEPAALILEITESLMVEDSTRILQALTETHSMGIRLAIDDFGTGYSALSYLSRLPVDIIKMDRCFIADAHTAAGYSILGAITNLAHDLGCAVIAEGVETRREHDQVATVGCDLAQGFYYAQPASASVIRGHSRGLGRASPI